MFQMHMRSLKCHYSMIFIILCRMEYESPCYNDNQRDYYNRSHHMKTFVHFFKFHNKGMRLNGFMIFYMV